MYATRKPTQHWSHTLRWLVPCAVVHTNSNREGPVYRHTGQAGADFGLATIVRGVGTRRRAYGPRFISTELRHKGGPLGVINLYAPVWLKRIWRQAFNTWEKPLRRGAIESPEQCQERSVKLRQRFSEV